MTHRCSNTECRYFINGCTHKDISLDADGVCITSRRKQDAPYKQMMQYVAPIDHKRCER